MRVFLIATLGLLWLTPALAQEVTTMEQDIAAIEQMSALGPDAHELGLSTSVTQALRNNLGLQVRVRELEAAYISKHRNVENYPKTLFRGRRDRIDFTYLGHQRIADDTRESDQGAVSYFLENDKDIPGTKALMRREKVPIDDRPDKGGVVQKLAENVKSIEFEYWNPKDFDWERDWKAEMSDLEPMEVPGAGPNPLSKLKKAEEVLSESDDEFILPSRVRIHLVLKDSEGKEYTFESQARIYMREPVAW